MWWWARDACFASLRRLHRLRELALTRVTPRWFLRVRGMPADVHEGSTEDTGCGKAIRITDIY
jgi:hypothetical protein